MALCRRSIRPLWGYTVFLLYVQSLDCHAARLVKPPGRGEDVGSEGRAAAGQPSGLDRRQQAQIERDIRAAKIAEGREALLTFYKMTLVQQNSRTSEPEPPAKRVRATRKATPTDVPPHETAQRVEHSPIAEVPTDVTESQLPDGWRLNSFASKVMTIARTIARKKKRRSVAEGRAAASKEPQESGSLKQPEAMAQVWQRAQGIVRAERAREATRNKNAGVGNKSLADVAKSRLADLAEFSLPHGTWLLSSASEVMSLAWNASLPWLPWRAKQVETKRGQQNNFTENDTADSEQTQENLPLESSPQENSSKHPSEPKDAWSLKKKGVGSIIEKNMQKRIKTKAKKAAAKEQEAQEAKTLAMDMLKHARAKAKQDNLRAAQQKNHLFVTLMVIYMTVHFVFKYSGLYGKLMHAPSNRTYHEM